MNIDNENPRTVKLAIEIPEETYLEIKEGFIVRNAIASAEAIKNGTLLDEVPFDIELFQAGLMDIPKGMTNEEVIKALLPDLEVCSADSGVVEYANTAINIMASRKWLDSPYQKGDE